MAPDDLRELAIAELGGEPRIYAGRMVEGAGMEHALHRHPYHDHDSIIHYVSPGDTPLLAEIDDEVIEVRVGAGDTIRFPNWLPHAAATHTGPDRLFIVCVGGW